MVTQWILDLSLFSLIVILLAADVGGILYLCVHGRLHLEKLTLTFKVDCEYTSPFVKKIEYDKFLSFDSRLLIIFTLDSSLNDNVTIAMLFTTYPV